MQFEDLATSVEIEMKMRRQMTDNHLDEMRRERIAYEKRMKALADAEAAQKNMAASKKPKKKKKVEVEPPIVDETTYIDVDEEYVEYENEKFQEKLDSLSPTSLNLSDHDVNMREFQILGGILKIECLLKPLQTKEVNFQLFIRLSELNF